jgi:hypothetical protein
MLVLELYMDVRTCGIVSVMKEDEGLVTILLRGMIKKINTEEFKLHYRKATERMRGLARAEERTNCHNVGNDKDKIKARIVWLQLHLEELRDILLEEDFIEIGGDK